MYPGLRSEHLYLFIIIKELNFAGIYDKRKNIVMELPFQGYKQFIYIIIMP
jgi:hypothetical protein